MFFTSLSYYSLTFVTPLHVYATPTEIVYPFNNLPTDGNEERMQIVLDVTKNTFKKKEEGI